MKLRLVVTIMGVLVAVLISAPAIARPRLSFTIYKVNYEGSGTYKVTDVDGPSHAETTANFNWDVTYTLNIEHKAGAQVGGLVGGSGSGGSGHWTIASDNGGGEVCSKSGGLKLGPNGEITGHVSRNGTANMFVVPGPSGDDYKTTGGSSGSQACDTTDFWRDWVVSYSFKGGPQVLGVTVDPLTALIHLTKSDQRAGKVIFNVNDRQLGALNPDCGSGDGATCTQSFDWSGHVTLIKKRSVTY